MYLLDDDLNKLKYVVEVSFISDSVAHQQSGSMTRSSTFKTAPDY